MVFSAFSSIAVVASVGISILGSYGDEKLLRAFLRAFVVSNFLLQLLPLREELLVAQSTEVRRRRFFFSVVFLPSLVVSSSLSASRRRRRGRRRRRSGRRRRSALRRRRRGRGRRGSFISPPLCHFDVMRGWGISQKLFMYCVW